MPDPTVDTIARETLWSEPTEDGLRQPRRLRQGRSLLRGAEREPRRQRRFQARLPEQFDAVMHFDRTSALEPLERWARDEVDLPETYPTGI